MLNVHITLEGSSMIKKPDVCFSRAAGTSRMSGVGIVNEAQCYIVLYTPRCLQTHCVFFFFVFLTNNVFGMKQIIFFIFEFSCYCILNKNLFKLTLLFRPSFSIIVGVFSYPKPCYVYQWKELVGVEREGNVHAHTRARRDRQQDKPADRNRDGGRVQYRHHSDSSQ